jgi:hypothetical protein
MGRRNRQQPMRLVGILRLPQKPVSPQSQITVGFAQKGRRELSERSTAPAISPNFWAIVTISQMGSRM